MKQNKKQKQGRLFILTGPSGVGKTVLMRRMLADFNMIKPVVSYTTRAKRPGEQDGVDYCFVSNSQFEKLEDKGFFIEVSRAYQAAYGTPRSIIDEVNNGKVLIMAVDIYGAVMLQAYCPLVRTIYILPPSFDELKRRLENRGEEQGKIVFRLDQAMKESGDLERIVHFQYRIINDSICLAEAKIKHIIEHEIS